MTVRQRRVLELVDALGLPEGTPALDAGCGPGYRSRPLGRGGFRLLGMDASGGMLDAASARLQQARPAYPITLKVGNIEDLPVEDSLDLVTW